MAATIGIKVANGEFYPIIEENSAGKKRLILTTVHDGQKSVQIDLYKSFTRTMAEAMYIGSLVVENISPKKKGEPSVELIISSNEEGIISADSIDLDGSGAESQHLSVALKSFDDDLSYDIPDFELETGEASDSPPPGLYAATAKYNKPGKKRSFLILIIAIIVGLLLAGVLLWFFVFHGSLSLSGTVPVVTADIQAGSTEIPPAPVVKPESDASQSAPPVIGNTTPPAGNQAAQNPAENSPVPAAKPETVTPPAPTVQSPPQVIVAPRAQQPAPTQTYNRERPVPPVRSFAVPATIPRDGFAYRIRWGDTLWDIADAFYRNPWLYPRIARFNGIRNPDRIISGTTIRVPPRN
ncbi:peptidoglycan-binding protein LysM [Spirochaetia bacterium]|nr:peptidoglycan-binding protein LysM [Spirochaetia bacterium]